MLELEVILLSNAEGRQDLAFFWSTRTVSQRVPFGLKDLVVCRKLDVIDLNEGSSQEIRFGRFSLLACV